MTISLAVVNKNTNIVENIIVVENLPNHEEPEHYYVSLENQVKNVRKGWQYDNVNYEFFTDDVEPEYTPEEILQMEELAWQKMLETLMNQQNSNAT